MAIFATQENRVTDEMFIEAGQAVADQIQRPYFANTTTTTTETNPMASSTANCPSARILKCQFVMFRRD